jgi:uncharacterized protein with FMN-binding domain
MLLANRNVKVILGAATIGSLALTDPSYAAAQTFIGNVFANPHGGSVQVQITVDAGKITAITTPVSPGGGNSQYTNYAVPVLVQEALAAQSATINAVSGASQISAAWKQSLASAISKAGSTITKSTSTGTSTPTLAPAPIPTRPAFTGGDDEGEGSDSEHENGEGNDDGYRAPRPKKSRVATIKPTLNPTPTQTSNSLGLTMGAGVIKKTITCVNGKQIKTVKALKPKCPTGFTLKKK